MQARTRGHSQSIGPAVTVKAMIRVFRKCGVTFCPELLLSPLEVGAQRVSQPRGPHHDLPVLACCVVIGP